MNRLIAAAIIWAALATVALAQMLSTIVLNTTAVVNSYNPLGVAITNESVIGTVAPLGVTNTFQHTLSFWINANQSNAWSSINIQNDNLINSNPGTSCEVTGGSGFAPGFCLSFDNSTGGAQFNFNNSTGTTNATDAIKFNAAGPTGAALVNYGQWAHYLVSFDSSNGSYAVYVNGADLHSSWTAFIPTNAVPDFNNATGWRLNLNNGALWAADIYESNRSIVCTGVGLGPGGTTAAPYNTCSGANTIPASILAKFISGVNGVPVTLGTNCAGPDGSQPQICLNGAGNTFLTNSGSSAAAFSNMVINGTSVAATATASAGSTTVTVNGGGPGVVMGTGAGCTLIDSTSKAVIGAMSAWAATTITMSTTTASTVTNADNLFVLCPNPYTASSPTPAGGVGPAGLQSHVAGLQWVTGSEAQASSTGTITPAAHSNGNTININDLTVLVVNVLLNSGTLPTVTCPTGWTKLDETNNTTGSYDTAICYAIQTSATASKTDYSVTFTITTAATLRSTDYALLDFGNVNTSTPFDVHGCQQVNSGSTPSTPTLTTTASNDLLVSILTDYNSQASTSVISPPSTGNEHYRGFYSYGRGGQTGLIQEVDEQLVGSGNNTARTFTNTIAYGYNMCSFTVEHN